MKNYILSFFICMLFSCSSVENKKTITDLNQTKNEGFNSNKKRITDSQQNTNERPIDWQFLKVEGKNIVFKDGGKFETNLYDLKYIGQLSAKNKAPFLILSGRSCTDCDENISLYIHSPSDGPMPNELNLPRYNYPGREYDYMTQKLVFESRMFYNDSGAFWVQKGMNDKGQIDSSIFSVEVNADTLREITEPFVQKKLDTLISHCTELPGMNFSSEP